MTYRLGKKAYKIIKKYGYGSKDVLHLQDRYKALSSKRSLSSYETIEYRELKFVVDSFKKQWASYLKRTEKFENRD